MSVGPPADLNHDRPDYLVIPPSISLAQVNLDDEPTHRVSDVMQIDRNRLTPPPPPPPSWSSTHITNGDWVMACAEAKRLVDVPVVNTIIVTGEQAPTVSSGAHPLAEPSSATASISNSHTEHAASPALVWESIKHEQQGKRMLHWMCRFDWDGHSKADFAKYHAQVGFSDFLFLRETRTEASDRRVCQEMDDETIPAHI